MDNQIRGIVDPWRQCHHFRLLAATGSHRFQHREEPAGIVVDPPNSQAFKHPRKSLLQNGPILQYVGNPRGDAQVIFENVKLAVSVTNEIRSIDVAPDATGRIKTNARGPESFRGLDDLERNDLVFDDLLLVVNVVNEEVQGLNALPQPALDPFPILRADQARDEIKWEYLFLSLLFAIDIEGDAHVLQIGDYKDYLTAVLAIQYSPELAVRERTTKPDNVPLP